MSDTSLTRFTVNLTSGAVDALRASHTITGDNATDTTNRALQAYAELLQAAVQSDATGHAERDLTVRMPEEHRYRVEVRPA